MPGGNRGRLFSCPYAVYSLTGIELPTSAVPGSAFYHVSPHGPLQGVLSHWIQKAPKSKALRRLSWNLFSPTIPPQFPKTKTEGQQQHHLIPHPMMTDNLLQRLPADVKHKQRENKPCRTSQSRVEGEIYHSQGKSIGNSHLRKKINTIQYLSHPAPKAASEVYDDQ